MDAGSGGRNRPYFRISVPGKSSLTLDGILSDDKFLTHIDLVDGYLETIIDILAKYGGLSK